MWPIKVSLLRYWFHNEISNCLGHVTDTASRENRAVGVITSGVQPQPLLSGESNQKISLIPFPSVLRSMSPPLLVAFLSVSASCWDCHFSTGAQEIENLCHFVASMFFISFPLPSVFSWSATIFAKHGALHRYQQVAHLLPTGSNQRAREHQMTQWTCRYDARTRLFMATQALHVNCQDHQV